MTRPPKKDNTPIAPTEEDESDILGKMKPVQCGNALLAVTTFCERDVVLLEKRAEFMRFLGVKPTHVLLLIADTGTSDEAIERVKEAHAPCFKAIEVRRINSHIAAEGWPRSVNKAFRNTVYLLHGMHGKKFDRTPFRGWYYFESDITPLVPDFLDRLQAEYLKYKKPYCGVIGEVINDHGKPIRHMNGSAIYPFGMQYFGEQIMLVENVPWDVCGLSGNLLRHVHDLTHHIYSMHFSTYNYKRVAPGTYEAIKRPVSKPAFDVTISINGHWFHHGCKDYSLINDLMGVKTPEVSPSIPPSGSQPLSAGTPIKTFDSLAIKEDAKTLKWKDLIKKHRISPRDLKKILA